VQDDIVFLVGDGAEYLALQLTRIGQQRQSLVTMGSDDDLVETLGLTFRVM
jgi:hypothetical protein